MITFGYKNRFSSILRACAAIAIGLVMLVSNNATETVVKIIAAFLFAAGVITYAHGSKNTENSAARIMMSVNAVADIVIGVILFCFPAQVAHLIVYLIGIIILLFGVLQVVALAGTLSLMGAGFFSMILSAVALLCGIVLIFNPFSQDVMGAIAGFALIAYGVSEIVSAYRLEQTNKERKTEAEKVTEPFHMDNHSGISTEGIADAKEVDFEKEDGIDEQ